MTDDSERRKRQLAFELLRVYEKHSNHLVLNHTRDKQIGLQTIHGPFFRGFQTKHDHVRPPITLTL